MCPYGTMTTIALCAVLCALICPALSTLCNVTDVVSDSDTNSKYFSLGQNNSCYVFALKKATIKDARRYCGNIGGHLTDVDSFTDNILKKFISEIEANDFKNEKYWIGLLWSNALDLWYWDNGANVSGHIVSLVNNFKTKGVSTYDDRCVTMAKDQVDSSDCSGQELFICKLNLECYMQSPAEMNGSVCSQRCADFIQEYKSERVSDAWAESTTKVDNTTVSATAESPTFDTTPADNEESKQTSCKIHNDGMGKQSVIFIAVLGGVTAVLLVAVVVLSTIIGKYRRMLGAQKTSPRISLVDILHADNAEKTKRKPSEQGSSNLGSTSELLYSNADNTPSNPNYHVLKTPQISDIYVEQNVFPRTGKPFAASLPPVGHSSDLVQNPASNEYSHLNRNGEIMDNAQSENMYGIQSASDRVADSSMDSPIYES